MELKLLSHKTIPHAGYGAGSGEIINEEYQCPCGEAKVFYEKDAIPGFRESSTWCTCKICNEKYEFKRGIAHVNSNV